MQGDGIKGLSVDQLVVTHLKLARRLAQRFCSRYGIAEENREDFHSAAMLGLASAAAKFDPALGVFVGFAIPTINGAMHDELRRILKAERFARESPHEFSEHLGVVAVPQLNDDQLCFDFVYADQRAADDNVIYLNAARAARQLSEMDRRIIHSLYVEDMSHAAVAEQIGVSRDWVTKRHANLMFWLREKIERRKLPAINTRQSHKRFTLPKHGWGLGNCVKRVIARLGQEFSHAEVCEHVQKEYATPVDEKLVAYHVDRLKRNGVLKARGRGKAQVYRMVGNG